MAESNIKSQDLKKGSVAILNASGNVVGSGFIAAPNYYICTCAHVVESTGNSDKIEVIFFNGIKGIAIVEVLDKNADIAILISNSIPKNAKPLILGESQYSDGQSFRSFGFPNRVGELSGGYAQGNIMGAISNGLLQITGDSVEPGMSGSPILGVESNLVIGMLSMFRDNKNQARIAYAIPTELLQKTYQKLDLQKPSRRQVEPNQEQTYRQAIQKDPKDTTAYLRLGNLLEKQKKLIEAEELFRNAIKAIPNDSRLYRELGRALELQAKFEEAMEFYEKSIQLNPKDGRSYQSMGILQRKLGDFERAIMYFSRAIEILPNEAGIYRDMGTVYEQQDRIDEAITAYRKANELRLDSGWTNRRIEGLEKRQRAGDNKPSTPDSSNTIPGSAVQSEPVISEALTTENILSEQPDESGNGNEPPVTPTTTEELEPSHPEPTPESSEVVRQYTIQDNALEKHAATDKPIQNVEQDKLGFGVYVTALHDFIVSQYTTTPLTISVDGPWGAGKSSLMYMLKNSLEPQNNIWQRFVSWLIVTFQWWTWFFLWFFSLPVQTFGRVMVWIALKFDKDTEEFDFRIGKSNPVFKSLITDIAQGLSTNPEVLQQKDNELSARVIWWAKVHARCEPLEAISHPTIWLNAWKFDNQEEVWASLALATLEQLKQKRNILWMVWFRIRLTFKRMSFLSALGTLSLQFALPLVLGIVAFYYTVILESFETPLKAFDTITQGFGNYLLWAGGILSGILTVSSIFKDPFQISVDKVFDRPNYKEKVGFLTRFEQDFAKVIELVTSNGFGWKKSKLIIFIDDLDRCEPPKSADIVEAINLFLDADGCVFVIGMDSEAVAKSIEVKYKDLFDRIKAENGGVVSLGRAFLEKIVQIPFTVPRATPGQILNMVEDTLGGNASKGIAIKQAQAKPVVIAPENDQDVVEGENQTPIQTESIHQPETTTDGKPDVKLDPASFEREEVRQAIRLGTKLLSENPRQVKTFVNLFRLSIYIANARGFFEEGRKGEKLRLIGLDRLAIWVTCSVRWQNLVRHLYAETQMNSLCVFLYEVSKGITTEYKWTTGNKNIPAELKKKIDNMRKGEKSSEAHWCHLPWEWWLLEPDFLQVVKCMDDLWAVPTEGEADQLRVLLNMSRPLSPTSSAQAK